MCLGVVTLDVHARLKRTRSLRSKSSATARSEKLTIIVDGKVFKSVPLTTINNIRYCSLQSLRTSSTSRGREPLQDPVISQHRISVQRSSFFIKAEDDEKSHIAQMMVPCIARQNNILVPFPHFFDALATLGLCTIDEQEKSVHWMKNTVPQHLQAPRIAPTLKATGATRALTKPDGRRPDHDQDSPENSPVYQPRSSSPLRYQLPPDLKRRELDDTSYHMEPEPKLNFNDVDDDRHWLASLCMDLKTQPTRIVKISSSVEKKQSRIDFITDRSAEEPEQPQFEQGVITVKFPKCVNAVKDLKAIRRLNVRDAESYLDGGTQVFKITLKSVDRQVRLERISSTHYVLHITQEKATAKQKDHSQWDLNVIVIDAGHGGKDGGTESIHKKHEKDIALSIALKLRDELKKRVPKAKIVMTRSTDVFIELDKRGEIANKAKGRLFISIHCNSTPTKPSGASGFETYVLSPAKTENAIEVAQRENAVIKLEEKSDRYKGMTDDQLIVATLAQNSFMKLSTTFAGLVQKHLGKTTTLSARNVNQAGFIVLIGASMPAVLVETGFVSNTKDEKVLTTSTGQLSIARGIADAVKEYSATYSRILHD